MDVATRGIPIMSILSNILKSQNKDGDETPVVSAACGKALNDIGFNVAGNVYQLRNRRGQTGWLISLVVPFSMTLRPLDSLALRTFLSDRICEALSVSPGSIKIIVNLNSEATELPFETSIVTADWLRGRIQDYKARDSASKTSSIRAAARSSTASVSGLSSRLLPYPPTYDAPPMPRVTAPTSNPVKSFKIKRTHWPHVDSRQMPLMDQEPPATQPAEVQTQHNGPIRTDSKALQARLSSLIAKMGDDGYYVKPDASTTDF